jgi:hypothetical protein
VAGFMPDEEPIPVLVQLEALENSEHSLSLQEWGAWLLEVLPREYAENPPGPPTAAAPGTRAKIEVMRERFRLRQPLSSPGDAELPDKLARNVCRLRNGAAQAGAIRLDRRDVA